MDGKASHRSSDSHGLDCPTPYFVLDASELRASVARFRSCFPGAEIYYAVKANPHSAVVAILAANGCGFEAASWGEIEQLLNSGVPPQRIIYGTAVKPRSHIERAVAAGIDRFAADSREELELLAVAAPGSRVFIRAAVDDSHSVFRLSGRFGAPLTGMTRLLTMAAEAGLGPLGISFHVGSEQTRVQAWGQAIKSLVPILADLLESGVRLGTLNVGGGFPTVYTNHPAVPRLEAIAEDMEQALESLPFRPQLILEPGRGLVATSTSLVTSVVARVERPDGTWLHLDGGIYNALFEAMVHQGDTRYPVSRIDVGDALDSAVFVLAGPTGDSLDVVSRGVSLPADTRAGHQLIFANAGAYTLAMASGFNGFPIAAVHLQDDIGVELPRVEAGATDSADLLIEKLVERASLP